MDIKTEHNGPKRGNGNYWGRKRFAKWISNKMRRKMARKIEILISEDQVGKMKEL